MSHPAITVLLGLLAVFILKIVLSWIRQVHKILTSNVPSPGIPLPLLGHSWSFVNVSPQNVVDVIFDWVQRDEKRRKVSICVEFIEVNLN